MKLTPKKYFSELLNRALVAKKKYVLLSLILLSVVIGFTACKAWRTVSTSATYVQQNDSAQSKITTTISTKTVEEWQGAKKK